jgi:Transposase IS116/IS110/IS902 family
METSSSTPDLQQLEKELKISRKENQYLQRTVAELRLEAIQPDLSVQTRLSRDLKNAAKSLSLDEARFLVDNYYSLQKSRITAGNQIQALEKATSEEPHETIDWFNVQARVLEENVKRALDRWTDSHPVGQWAKSIVGIGPVLSAGLLAHIDITRCPTAGHIWSFAGLNPEQKWEKGGRRPWNAELRAICWRIGESFVKFSGNPRDFYGKIWRERKELEVQRNEAGLFKARAEESLSVRKYGKDTDAYKWLIQGKLPPAHIHARAKRYAVKLFLAHYHEVAYKLHYGVDPPLPYPIAHLGHVHKIAVPVGA